MKRTFILLAGILISALTTTGCEEDIRFLSTNSSAIDRVKVGDLTFTLQILDMHGKPQDQFREGEHFQFQFIVENKSNHSVALPVYWTFPVTNSEFFALYRKTQESGGRTHLGKSFQLGLNTRDLGPASVLANGKAIYTMPWFTSKDTFYTMPVHESAIGVYNERGYMATDTPPRSISAGEYFTGFTIQYSETGSVRLEASFTVR